MARPLLNRLVVALLDLVEAIDEDRSIVVEGEHDIRQSRPFLEARALLAEIADADTDAGTADKPQVH
jgi:hypothetical protein